MPALGLTLLILLVWLVQGLGFVQWLMPQLRQQSVVSWIVAMWLGLLGSLVVLVNLYMWLPFTLDQLAWPVTIALTLGSSALYIRTQRPALRIDAASICILALTAFATVLVLRPLIAHTELGYYYSNNGEFTHYAAISDSVQYLESSARIDAFGLHSREAVLGVTCSVISALTGKAALWVIQPLSAAFAALAFATLGLLFRHLAVVCKLNRSQASVLGLVYAWPILSASAQMFWTLAFSSQFLNMALFFGGILVIVEGELAPRVRIGLLGLLIAGLVLAYPEMAMPSVALLGAFELSREIQWRERWRIALGFVGALAIGAILANRLGAELMPRGGEISPNGWAIFGPHRPVFAFFASVVGFTNPFAGPSSATAIWPVLAAVAFAASLAFAILRVRKETEPSLRAIMHLGWIFALGVAALFWIVARRGTGNNYPAVKFILGFGWFAYLLLGVGIAQLVRWRPRALPVIGVALCVMWVGLVRPAIRYTKLLHRVEHESLFLEGEAAACREVLGPQTKAFISAGWFYDSIIGYFIAYDHAVYAADGTWPSGDGEKFDPTKPIVLVGRDFKLSDDKRVSGNYVVRCAGRFFSVLYPR